LTAFDHDGVGGVELVVLDVAVVQVDDALAAVGHGGVVGDQEDGAAVVYQFIE